MKSAAVVDTNVLMVANEASEQAGPECIETCVQQLAEIRSGGLIVIDDGYRILREYQRGLDTSRPGVGNEFLLWIYRNQANEKVCEQVPITESPNGSDNFVEFPNNQSLHGFDPADRKFVAVAVASQNRPAILNATDTDWWQYREALRIEGVEVSFLCPQLMG